MFIKRKLFDTLDKYKDSRESIVITGFRRTGKTSLLEHLYQSTPSTNKIFLDLESPVNQNTFKEVSYDNIKRKLSNLGLDFGKKTYIFIDEIQMVKSIPSVVKYLSDHNDIKFYLTGSSSFYLKNFFSESLSGRKFLFELFPLDFEEFLWFKNEKLSVHADYDFLSGFYEEYLKYGGLPGVVLEESPEKKLLKIDEALASYFNLDVKSLAGFRDNENLKKLLFLLSSRVGSKPDVSKLSESLGVSRETTYKYLSFLEQTYLIHLLRPYSSSHDVQIRSLPKIYFSDTGILSRVAEVSKGQAFENKVFNQLYTRAKLSGIISPLQEPIYYYQTTTGSEIDFVTQDKKAYEAKTLGSTFDLARLKRVCHKIGIENYKIVSLEKTRSENPGIIYPFTF